MSEAIEQARRVYRTDKFVVPALAWEEFLEKVQMTHALLRTQQGFVQDFLLEQTGGPGEFNLVTMVEWEGPEFIDAARAAVMAMHREDGFNPQELMTWLGIRADMGSYRRLAD
jgi:hypothetical protein